MRISCPRRTSDYLLRHSQPPSSLSQSLSSRLTAAQTKGELVMARFFTHDYFCSGYGGKVKVESQFKNKCKMYELLQTGIYLKQDLTFTIDN